VPGAAWGIIVDGELAHSGATGFRDIASKSSVDADTVFRIASMTKSFTAMSILKLRDEGKLSQCGAVAERDSGAAGGQTARRRYRRPSMRFGELFTNSPTSDCSL